MARIRTIKPEFWTDSFMVQLPPLARLIYIALWTAADDHGGIADESERLAMEVMPREDPVEFDDWLQFFEASGRLDRLIADDGSTCLRIAKWEQHQRVDKPSRSKIIREDSRKLAIPLPVRRAVAEKYGCAPGSRADASCYYCGAKGSIHWHQLASGRPSGWVTFPGLELDHLIPEASGGEGSCENIVLACRHCNRSKKDRSWIDRLCLSIGVDMPRQLASPRECSGTERNREQGREEETTAGVSPSADPVCRIVVEEYHRALPKCQRAEVLAPKRRRRILHADKLARQLCAAQGWEFDREWFWSAYFGECAQDPWLRGEVPNPKNPRWKQNLDVLLAEDRFAGIMDAAIGAMRLQEAA